MKNPPERINGRKHNQLRNVEVQFNLFGYADASVLYQVGNTKVLCAVNLQQGVPYFLKSKNALLGNTGKKSGWLNAEYSMLPSSTTVRTVREISSMRRNGRSVEISRLISRSLRTIVDLSLLGERTITIDCDVLQADGGTRTACITGASLALRLAVNKWINEKIINENILIDQIAAVSVGVIDGEALLDIEFSEDKRADADFNFVLTRSNKIVEVQGASEGVAVSWQQFDEVKALAVNGIEQLFAIGDQYLEKMFEGDLKKVPLFSLQNRTDLSV